MNNKVREVIYNLTKDGAEAIFTIADIPQNILNDDCEIDIERNEGHYSQNDSYESNSNLVILRWRDKTPEELEKERLMSDIIKQNSRKNRYETYLKLKKEFESEG